MEEQPTPREKWYWPTIVDLPGAISASDKGFWAAAFVAGTTLIIATVSLILSREIVGFDAWSYIDALVWAIIAWAIRRRSRIGAVSALLLYLLDRVVHIAAFGSGGLLGFAVTGFLLAMFVIGIKGTFSYHTFKSETSEDI